MMGYLSNYYNTFQVAWGYAFDVEFSDLSKFPTLASIMPNALGYGSSDYAKKCLDWDILQTRFWNTSAGIGYQSFT